MGVVGGGVGGGPPPPPPPPPPGLLKRYRIISRALLAEHPADLCIAVSPARPA
jgi:hypothetical protein